MHQFIHGVNPEWDTLDRTLGRSKRSSDTACKGLFNSLRDELSVAPHFALCSPISGKVATLHRNQGIKTTKLICTPLPLAMLLLRSSLVSLYAERPGRLPRPAVVKFQATC
jgi:hypothetical protein